MSDSAITIVVSGIIQIMVLITGFFTLWIKLKYGTEEARRSAVIAADAACRAVDRAQDVEDKIDHNTNITKVSTAEAIANAKIAASVATEAKEVATSINKKLNGGIESAILPLHRRIDEHAKIDEMNMNEVREKLDLFITNEDMKKFADYVHQRNHDMLDAMNALSLKLDVLNRQVPKGTQK